MSSTPEVRMSSPSPPITTCGEDAEVHPFYLNNVPAEVLDNILRFWSRIPNAKTWETHIPLADIPELYGVVGQFGRFMSNRFTALCVSKSITCIEENEQYGWNLKTGPMLWTSDIDVAHSFVLAGCGKSLRTLVVGQDMYDKDEDGTELVDDFLRECPNVTSLSISETESAWISRFAKQLETAEISSRAKPVFPHDITLLRALSLHSVILDTKYTGLWEQVGNNLESLSITGECNPKRDFPEIQKNCRNLTSIRIEGRTVEEFWNVSARPTKSTFISNLLASFGAELKYVYLSDMADIAVREAIEACKHARFQLAEIHGLSTSTLSLIGSRLDKISMYGFKIADSFAEWKETWDGNTKLNDIHINDCEVKHLDAIMNTPKYDLKNLKICVHPRMGKEEVKKMMLICSKATNAVEKLSINGPRLYRKDLDTFIEKNRETMASITIYRKYDYYRPDEKLDDLIESFLELPALQELRIDCIISKPLRTALEERGVYAAIPR